MDIKYKKDKHYNTSKRPIRQPRIIVWLIKIVSKILLSGEKYTIEKVNMEGLEPPYILLSNHMSFIDFELTGIATYPHRVNNVVTIDGYYRRPWLMELIGSICKRKFTTDLSLVRSIHHVIKKGDVLCMYPEARYSPIGTTAYLPDTLGRLVKMNKVPVVCAVHHGNYLRGPFWNYRQKRKVPLLSTYTQVLTADDVKRMSVDEINAVIKESLTYDEYKYQKENGISISEPYRAQGLHKVLYRCPHCNTEFKMASEGCELYCKECSKRWTMNTDGSLSALSGETGFSHIPDWFEWERTTVRDEILRGEYSFSDTVDVYSLPTCMRFKHLGKAKLTHDLENGFVIEGEYNSAPYRIQRTPVGLNGLHVEYDYCYIKPYDCIDISTDNDSLYCYPEKENVITKLSFATEEMHRIKNSKAVYIGVPVLDTVPKMIN